MEGRRIVDSEGRVHTSSVCRTRSGLGRLLHFRPAVRAVQPGATGRRFPPLRFAQRFFSPPSPLSRERWFVSAYDLPPLERRALRVTAAALEHVAGQMWAAGSTRFCSFICLG